jgi:hypothetical protein
MTIKKKILIFFCIKLIIIFLAIVIIVTINSDISDKELGPSPFIIETDFTSEDDPAAKKIIEIGKTIQGVDEFKEKYSLDLNNPEPSIVILKEFIQLNQVALDKIKPELFKSYKPKKQKIDSFFNEDFDDEFEQNLQKVLTLLQRKTTLDILSLDFDNTKIDFMKANGILNDVAKKPTGILSGMLIGGIKIIEISNIKLFLNQEKFTLDQKLEVISFPFEPFEKQFLITIAHFESQNLKNMMLILTGPSSKLPKDMNIPFYMSIFKTFFIQKNKTEIIFRENFLNSISDFENFNLKSISDINNKFNLNASDFYKGNAGGKIILSMFIPVLNICIKIFAKHNNWLRQIKLAKAILEYKKNTGLFPIKLEDLKLDNKSITDLCTEDSFLYSPQNGILQSVGQNGINNCPELTTKELTESEIKALINNIAVDDDFIIYLK